MPEAVEQHENSTRRSPKDWLAPYQFKTGQSGNANGRPVGSLSLREKLKARLRENPDEADEILRSLLLHAYHGDAAMMKLVIDGVDGPQALRIEGLSEAAMIQKLAGLLSYLKERLPRECLPALSEAAREYLGQESEP